MSTGDERIPGIDSLRAAYRDANFDDEPSPELDAALHAAARRARRPRQHNYIAPLALAATVVVAVGLVLRLTALGPEPIEPAALQRERAPAAPPATLPSPTADALSEEPAVPAAERAAELRPVGLTAATSAASASTADAPRAPDSAALPQTCAASRAMAPEAWLACISSALDAGNVEAARAERAAFAAAYPDVPIPAALDERLRP